jgi:hypothetical protein
MSKGLRKLLEVVSSSLSVDPMAKLIPFPRSTLEISNMVTWSSHGRHVIVTGQSHAQTTFCSHLLKAIFDLAKWVWFQVQKSSK